MSFLESPVQFDFGPSRMYPDVLIACSHAQQNHTSRFVLSRMVDYLSGLATENPAQILSHLRIVLQSAEDTAQCTDPLNRAQVTILCQLPPAGFRAVPHVSLNAPTQDERENAFLLGLPAIIETTSSIQTKGKSTTALATYHGERYPLVIGTQDRLELESASLLFQGLLHFLAELDHIDCPQTEELETDTHFMESAGGFELTSHDAGYFVASSYSVSPWVQKGDLIGTLYHASNGREIQRVTSPVTGLVTYLRSSPLIESSEVIAVVHAA